MAMIDSSLFRRIARASPAPIRRMLGCCWNYATRVARWHEILTSVRGQSATDQLILIASAVVSPVTSVAGLGEWRDPVLVWDACVQVTGIGKFLLRRYTDDLWHVLPRREPAVLGTIEKYLESGSVFLDAGANIGVYTVLAGRKVGESGRVIAVEMMPDTAKILRRHLAINKLQNVVVVEKALADSTGNSVIARVPEGKHGQASIASGVDNGLPTHVRTVTLAEILNQLGEVTLMKMDVEGAEEIALVGAGDSLQRVRAVIFEDRGDTHVPAMFRARGFSVERLDGANCLATLSAG